MTYIERRLWFGTDGTEPQWVTEEQLLQRSEPLVVLGEPGMGKSQLLSKLAKDARVGYFKARQIINRPDPATLVGNPSLLIIDALDEVATRQVGDAVDHVLQKLGILGYPRFLLSCRVADWRAATSASAIAEQYAVKPLQLHLAPLTREEQTSFLAQYMDSSDAERILSHFDSFDLAFLGNPQTLELVARLPAGEPLPENSTELFERATDNLRAEHRDSSGGSEPAKDTVIDAAGAAFAGLIITGSASITRRASANLAGDEIQFGEADNLADGNLGHAIGTRLFSGSDDSFSYWHRRIGEFLGAKWLSKRANTPQKRKRLLQIFKLYGLVPANLRGLHAWLAHDANLATAVIRADPMGVIEYGDADALPPTRASELLDALKCLAQKNPNFLYRTQARCSALAQPELREDFDRILMDKTAAVGLRILLAEQLLDAGRAKARRTMLRERLLDSSEVFAIRRRAGDALVYLADENWRGHLEELRCQGVHDSVRLAFELMRHVGVESFSDHQVVEVTLAYGGLTLCSIHQEDRKPLRALFWRFSAEIPDKRLDTLLGTFSEFLMTLFPDGRGSEFNQTADFVYELILRRLESNSVDPQRLWSWLKPFVNHRIYPGSAQRNLEHRFQAHNQARRAIQHHVLLDESGESIREKRFYLTFRWKSLAPDEGDVVALLAKLDPADRSDLRWCEVLEMIPHDSECGRAARDAAEPFVAHHPQLRDWLKRLVEPPSWLIEQNEEERKCTAKREAEFRDQQREYSKNLEKVRSGEFFWILDPASAYLNKFMDIGDRLPAHERIAEWLGADIAQAAHEGFEAFLVSNSVQPTASQMAASFARDQRWDAGDIIVAALAERLRTQPEPFEGLPDERLMAGAFVLWNHSIDYYAGIPELRERIEVELKHRGTSETAYRLYYTSQFEQRRPYIDLYRFMRSGEDADLASRLAVEWLEQYAEIAVQPESELIDRVLASAFRDRLKAIGDARQPSINDEERRRNWDAVQILIDFDAARQRLETEIETDHLWPIRDRSGSRHYEGHSIFSLSVGQIVWIVSVFRERWPAVDRPGGGGSGDTNPWDASEFIRALVDRLGTDTSEDAVTALAELRDAPQDGYTDHLRSVVAEQKKKRVEQHYESPTIQHIGAIINALPPVDAADLQAVIIDALSTVQAQLRGSDVDWYRNFFREDGCHKDEEPCRDALIQMLLTIKEPALEYNPEGHLADDKRVDIVVRAAADLILPIEVKGQWHRDLWTAADQQLDRLYLSDWRAERGIYLVLWFGADEKLHPVPDGTNKPTTPEALREKLCALSAFDRAGRVDVVVLDLTRPESE